MKNKIIYILSASILMQCILIIYAIDLILTPTVQPVGIEAIAIKVDTPVMYIQTDVMELYEIVEDSDPYISMESVCFKNDKGIDCYTVNQEIKYLDLMDAYNNAPYMEFDWKDKHKEINVLWEYLVNQQGLNPKYAAALIGNICIEGSFGLIQGTTETIDSIDEVRQMKYTCNTGYGIVQWTYCSRKSLLIDCYEQASENIDDFETARIVAECYCLLNEANGYDIFDKMGDGSVEHCTGVVALYYECYQNSDKQWKYNNGNCYLASTKGSGIDRLNYAKAIYDFYMNNEVSQ